MKTTKIFFILLFFLCAFSEAYAQRPVVNSISKTHATVNEEIAISGAGFGNATSNIRVFFGAVNAPATSVSENLIKVKVPAGATYGSIAVTNMTSGLTGYSGQQFGLSFGGDSFDPAKFNVQQDFNAGLGVFDLCLCDFDGDGKSDVATANIQGTDVGVFKNNSGANNIAFAARQGVSLGAASPTRNVNCGDIDGDGKPDLVVSGSGAFNNTIFVLRNTSTGLGNISFAAPILLTFGSGTAARIAIRDLDLDGKPELTVTNNSDNKLYIFPNTSTAGNISFAAATTITIQGASHSNGLAVEDLNNDGLPEIIVNTLQENNIYILKNNSTTGNFSFSTPQMLQTSGGNVNLVVGDLNNDGKPEIVVGSITQQNIEIFENTSSTNSLNFPNSRSISVSSRIWGLSLGDMDGNGTQDIVAVSHLSPHVITVLLNNSVPGNLSFSQESLSITENGRNIKVGDLNNDAKADLVFLSITSNKLSVRRNKNCIVPSITPAGPHTVCAGTPLKLSATHAANVNYQWQRNGSDITGATNSFIEPTQSGTYTVTISSPLEGCTETSEGVEVTIDTGSGLGATVQMDPISPVCVGGTIHLSATAVPGATYYWSGPNNFSTTTTTNTTTVTNATTAKGGDYSVIINTTACSSAPLTENAVVYGLPSPVITTSGSTAFCDENGSVLLSAGTNFSSYQWKKDGVAIAGATTSSYTTGASGKYTVQVTNATGCVNESAAITVNKFSPPQASFVTPGASCIDQEVAFKNTSVVEGNTVSYSWEFGDGHTSTDTNPSHAYTTAGTYQVKLTASYSSDCKSEITKTINIIEASSLEIIPEGSTAFCNGDSVKLTVPSGFQTYVWSNGSLTSSTYVKKTGTVHVTVKTTEGCTMSASIDINVSGPEVTITTDTDILKPGETTQLFASGAFTYSWEPAEGLNDPLISNPIASPNRTTTYTVTGTDDIGCSDITTITITVDNELNVTPKKLFVPASENTWKIEQIDYFPECSVIIFNKQGLKLYEQKDYANNPWDGTYNGQPMVSGVYYFVIRCNNEENAKTGSITLMR